MASRVYVIELAAAAGRRRDPRIPWVYVGSSARSPQARFEQHRRGYKSSGIVKRHAVRLRPDLYEDLPSLRGSRTACAAEAERAQELAQAGFVAHSDGVSHGERGGDWVEWDRERLEPVLAHLDGAIADLAASSFEPLEPGACARLLYGERGFWVTSHLDQDDPPPAYGQFAHVRLSLLEERCLELLASPSAPPAARGTSRTAPRPRRARAAARS